MHLSEVYSSLFCSATAFIPPVVAKVLLEKQMERDAAILQLSILRRLFESKPSADTAIERHKGELQDILLSTHNFVYSLISQLWSTDQFISFCAGKALVAVFLSCEVKVRRLLRVSDVMTPHSSCTLAPIPQAEWLSTLLSGDIEWLSGHVAIYRWQVFTELLKALRKLISAQQQSSSVLYKQNACFTALASTWSEILKLYTEAVKPSDQQSCESHVQSHTQLELSLGEFLSLTVEMLRHKDYSPHFERQVDSQLPCCQAAVVRSLLPLVSILEYSDSVTLLKRVLDVLLKITGHPVLCLDAVDQLLPHLTNILKARAFNRVFHLWMSMVKSRFIQPALEASFHQPQTIENSGSLTTCMREEDCGLDTGLLNTVVRKLILFLLKYTAAVLEREAQSRGPAALYSAHLDWVLQEVQVLTSSAGWNIPSDRATQIARHVLFQVLSEQDDSIVQALLVCCQIHTQHQCCGYIPDSSSLSTCVHIFIPHSLFIEFLQSIAYDHTVLVDFLMSSENKFLDLFHQYIKIATSDWKQLKATCLQYDGAELKSRTENTNHSNDDSHSHSSVSVKEPILYSDTVASQGCVVDQRESDDVLEAEDFAVKKQKLSSLPIVDSHCSKESGDTCTASNCCDDCNSEQQCDDSSSEVQSLYCETTLDRIMDCLTRLKFTITRLCAKSLLPGFPIGATVALLENLERLYEQESASV